MLMAPLMHWPLDPISFRGSGPREYLPEVLPPATQVIWEDELFPGLVILDSIFGLNQTFSK